MAFQSARSVSLPTASGQEVSIGDIIQLHSSGTARRSTASTRPIGVALEASASSETKSISVALLDGAIIEVMAGGNVSVGANVSSNASGKAVGSTGSNFVIGQALTAGSDENIMEVLTASVSRNS